MITHLDFRELPLDRRTLRTSLPRTAVDLDAAVAAVAPLVADVRQRGREAVLEYSERFDAVRPDTLRVPEAKLEAALAALDPQIRAALEETIERQRLVCRNQVRHTVTTDVAPGGIVRDRWLPVDRVGLYVPGGLAVYPSTVVMNVVPAQTAGVNSLAIASPPQADGLPHPTILAAARLLGVAEVYAIGGAQAVAAFAYGYDDETESLEPVDLITGPGNAYVAAAKAHVRGVVGIDSVAGPTEIIILADAAAQPRLVAADLISQAEHDPDAASVLVTDSAELIAAVVAELEKQVPATKHADRVRQALGGPQSAIIQVATVDDAIAVTNAYAGEHVEIMTADPALVAERITSGGAIFLGDWSPVSLGDYCAGSNHVLPTMGTARHSSGLSVQSFLKGSQIIDYDESGLREVAGHVLALSAAEDLPAHGEAVATRFVGGA